jgi:hypothetical protein
MLKILLEKWDKHKDLLKRELAIRAEFLKDCDYKDLVKLTFDIIYNTGEEGYGDNLDIKNITEIDNGDYQGTLLFLIPFDTYQPSEYDYLMTFVGYGSCCGCDTLQAIQYIEDELTPQDVNNFMQLCKDLICNTVKPYNSGWREDAKFEVVEVKEVNND